MRYWTRVQWQQINKAWEVTNSYFSAVHKFADFNFRKKLRDLIFLRVAVFNLFVNFLIFLLLSSKPTLNIFGPPKQNGFVYNFIGSFPIMTVTKINIWPRRIQLKKDQAYTILFHYCLTVENCPFKSYCWLTQSKETTLTLTWTS